MFGKFVMKMLGLSLFVFRSGESPRAFAEPVCEYWLPAEERGGLGWTPPDEESMAATPPLL